MLTVTIKVAAPGWAAQGVKEHLAMCLERFGDVKVIEVTEDKEQTELPGFLQKTKR